MKKPDKPSQEKRMYLYEICINPRRRWYTLWLKIHFKKYYYPGTSMQQARSKLFKLHGLCVVHKTKKLGRTFNN